jgi:SM-20-related protein
MLYLQVPGFFGRETVDALLDYAFDNEGRFEHTGIGTANEVTGNVRQSRKLIDLGPFAKLVEARVAALIPQAITALQLSPFVHTSMELELVAHEDGAFYRRHIDVFTDTHRLQMNSDRLLSVVYYFYREPKAFSGGELRIHPAPPLTTGPLYFDVAPEQDTAVVFSSWVPHEVMPVRCPSKRFADARFAINCWVVRSKAPPTDSPEKTA